MATYRNFEPQGAMRKQIEAFFEDSTFRVAEPRLAATVMLVADRGAGCPPKVFMMQRSSTMEFMPDAVVFPGGGVCAADYRLPSRWTGPSPAEWARVLRRSEEVAGAILMAAARELFEEAGVLLASGRNGRLLSGEDVSCLQEARGELAGHQLGFAQFLDEHELGFRSDLLTAQSCIVTPEFSKRRYDTTFFSARLPEGQQPDGKTSESAGSAWVDPMWVIEEADRGKLQLIPPTRYNLELVTESGSVSALMEANFSGETLRPGPYFDFNGVLKLGFRNGEEGAC